MKIATVARSRRLEPPTISDECLRMTTGPGVITPCGWLRGLAWRVRPVVLTNHPRPSRQDGTRQAAAEDNAPPCRKPRSATRVPLLAARSPRIGLAAINRSGTATRGSGGRCAGDRCRLRASGVRRTAAIAGGASRPHEQARVDEPEASPRAADRGGEHGLLRFPQPPSFLLVMRASFQAAMAMMRPRRGRMP